MPADELIKEVDRQLTICNACRYCEGFCAVWPAMELRRTFTRADVLHLSNLCFDCRACLYACQYAPPHAFDINIPKVFAQVRTDTYQEYAWPRLLARFVTRSAAAIMLIILACVAVVIGLVAVFRGPETLFTAQLGDGSFFRVVPYVAMTFPALLIGGYALVLFGVGAVRFWRDTRGAPGDLFRWKALVRATGDAFGLRYLKTDGSGCNYPTERFSHSRRIFHHLTFYGFLLDLASTTVAAIYHNVFGWSAPYPLLSLPVVLGSVGGIMLMIGTVGLLALKWRSDRVPSDGEMMQMDVGFLVVLFAAAATGMVLLVWRDTAAMPVLLAIHLGSVAAFFLTIPYGKFAHVVYRYAALVRNAIEERRSVSSVS